jgi:hypothetical protein
MDQVDGDLLRREPSGQLQGEQHIEQLGMLVGVAGDVALNGLEVLEGIGLPHLEGGRHHVEAAGGGVGPQQGQQLAGQGEWADEVHGQGGLIPVGRLPAGLVQAADVVHQHIQSGNGRMDLVGQPLVAADGGVVGLQEPHQFLADLVADCRGRLLAGGWLTAGDEHLGTPPGQESSRVVADAAGSSGDQDCPSLHGPLVGLRDHAEHLLGFTGASTA